MTEGFMRTCEHCAAGLEEPFRFCPWCGAPQRLKLVEHFRAHPTIEESHTALRVSRYLTETRHTRFSVWSESRVEAAISVDDDEAERLGRFLLGTRPRPHGALRRTARALRDALQV